MIEQNRTEQNERHVPVNHPMVGRWCFVTLLGMNAFSKSPFLVKIARKDLLVNISQINVSCVF